MTIPSGAMQIDISKFLRKNDLHGLQKLLNRGLNNRRTRDNFVNELSSRSLLILNVYTTTDTERGPSTTKDTYVDLAG